MRRFNSTIQIKKKKCKICGKLDFIFSKGRCRNCATVQDIKEQDESEKDSKNDLDRWYGHIIEKYVKPKPYCWNCGEPIAESYYRHSAAHIFPKSIFWSISTHPLNFLILGSSCGCHQDSHRLDKFSQMQVWGRAVQRFLAFEPEIKEKHKYVDEFKKYAKINIETI